MDPLIDKALELYKQAARVPLATILAGYETLD